MLNFRDLKVRSKFRVLSGFFLVALISIIVIVMFDVRKTLDREKQLKTRHLVESAYSILEYYHNLEKNRTLTTESAQKNAMDVVRTMHYEEMEYFWINDMHPKMIMHPYKPELDGQDISDFKDPKGKKLFIEFVNKVKNEKAGFVYYLWPKPGHVDPVEKLSYVKGFEPWGWIIGSGIYLDDIREALWNKILVYVVLCIVILSIISFMLMFFSQNLISPIREIHEKVEQISTGDLTVKVELYQKDELGVLAGNFNKMVDELRGIMLNLKSSIHQLTDVEKTSEELGEMVHKGSEEQHESVSRILDIFSDIERRLDLLKAKVASLVESIEATAASLLEVAASSSEISGVMESLNNSSQNLEDANVKLNNININLDEGAETLMQKVENLRSFSTEMDSAVKSTLGIVTETSAIASEMNNLAKESKSSIHDSITNMNSIAGVTEESREAFISLKRNIGEINSILTVIEEIAEKTNMLALNAAIISAQSDERGEAFSIVADEIKSLSQGTRKSTQEINDIIGNITRQTEDVFLKVQESAVNADDAAKHFKGIDTKITSIITLIDKVANGVQNIVSAANEQSQGSQIIRNEIEDLLKVSQSLSAIRDEGNSAGRVQKDAVQNISEITKKVNYSTREQMEAIDLVKKSVIELSEFSSELLDHFKQEIKEVNSAKPVLSEINESASKNSVVAEDLKKKFIEMGQLTKIFEEIRSRFRVSDD